MPADKQLKEEDNAASFQIEFDITNISVESGDDEFDERPRLSCSGSGRITRAFTLRQLRNILPVR